ncbi:MAG: hypothetical protein N3A69_12765 [Leptospiraceae bacterium]|nr:hypothetical protein [Leptospiraceae bacterium]
MKENFEKIVKILDSLIFAGSVLVVFFWLIGKPLFYSPNSPVMSIFTALSLFIISGVRLATRYLYLWPFTLSIAFLLTVVGGNLSSILMLWSASKVFINTSSSIVMTSTFTSYGLILFGIYEILVLIRRTPKSVFILDDILIHLALVPGELSLIGHLYNNPTYISLDIDPRVGISILEMCFMGALATSCVLGNPHLFLWEFLKGSLSNKIIFAGLFFNQYITPLLYLYIFRPESKSLGLEVFIMLAGVFATLGFLVLQAFQISNPKEKE